MTVSVKAPTSTTGSIQLNGSDVLTIDSSGNLTAPNNLTVTGTVTQTGTATFSGNVGIGTSSPDTGLHVKSAVSNGTYSSSFVAESPSDNYPAITFKGTSGNLFALRPDGSGSLTFNDVTSGFTERMRIDSSGNLRINGTANVGPSRLGINFAGNTHWGIGMNDTASANSSAFIVFSTGGTMRGLITNNNNTSVAYNTTSDYRLKENVAPMSGSIARLKQLKPSTWTWIQNGSHGEGFLAHEAQTVVPEAISGAKDAVDDEGNPVYQGIDQSKLVPLLTAALQEAITKIEDLETRIKALENA